MALTLFTAIKKRKLDAIHILLRDNPELVSVTYDAGKTPLHYAVLSNDVAIVLNLIKYGADVNAKDNNGLSPLQQAIRDGRTEIAKYLIEFGAEVNEGINLTQRLCEYCKKPLPLDAHRLQMLHSQCFEKREREERKRNQNNEESENDQGVRYCLICHTISTGKFCSDECKTKWNEFIGVDKKPVRTLSRRGTESIGRKHQSTQVLGGAPVYDDFDD